MNARDEGRCIHCLAKPPRLQSWPVDHILPVRLAETAGRELADSDVNTWVLCLVAHGQKTGIDRYALDGDMLSWAREMKIFCSDKDRMWERLEACVTAFGLRHLFPGVW